MRILLGLFMIAHGLIHASYLTPKPDDPNYPFHFDKGWFAQIVGSIAPTVGLLLVVVTIACFALAGLGILGVPGLLGIAKIMVIIGAVSSLLVLILFWHPWLVLGIVIDAVLLYAALKLNWPTAQ